MSLKRNLLLLSIASCLLSFVSPPVSAQTSFKQSHFTSVKGKVTVSQGGKSREVRKNSTVKQGDTVATGKNSSATLRFFDGSEIRMTSGTKFTIGKLVETSQDKIFNFNLAFGKLVAVVRKLISSRSSFEIDAGGVVCGVRGTEYEVDYDPNSGKMDLFVTDGHVWARAGGKGPPPSPWRWDP